MMKKTLLTFALIGSACLCGTVNADMVFPPDSLVVSDEGRVGVGTATPGFKLHVTGDLPGALLRLENTKKPRFAFHNSTTDVVWTFGMNPGDNLQVNLNDSDTNELILDRSGNLKISGNLTQGSDRNNKQAIKPVDSISVLETVAQLPVSTWEYKGQDGVKHLGPMAQDFHAAFGLGNTPKGISSIDTGGVALAAIKGLNEVVQQKETTITAQGERIAAQEREITALKQRLARMEEQQERLAQLEELLRDLAVKGEVAQR